ncbi:MAG: hypothetical protein JSW68_10915 [Burkholderiales bacterium]|nr:MAG: hypothetical protein JSW68_10915 [Burkholderiales bacterium]
MIGILVISHEPLGTALIHCTRHIFSRLPSQLAALDVIPDEDPGQALAGAQELLARINDGSGAVVLTDLFGATPSRVACRLVVPGRIAVVGGVNLPMLVRALNYRKGPMPLDQLVERIAEGGRAAIMPLELLVCDGEVAGEASEPPRIGSDGDGEG